MSPAARRGLIIFLCGLALLMSAFAFDYWWSRSDQVSGGNVNGFAQLSIGGPFTLVDQSGVTRHDSDFRGKLMLVYFGYTYCPDACPAALQTMSGAIDELGDRGKDVQPIFISIDPERDTVEQMKLYASNFHPRLLALTGTEEQTAAAAHAYRVYFDKVRQSGRDDYLMDHSAFVFLMGRDGHYLAHFAPDATADAMAAAIKRYL